MGLFLDLCLLFACGCVAGWVLELFYRRFSPANGDRKWITPGFCTGPWLPIYGFGLVTMYLLVSFCTLDFIGNVYLRTGVLFLLMGLCMTAIEFAGGLGLLKLFHLRLWDYSKEWGNIQGIICPKFTFFWFLCGVLYYFLLHPLAARAVDMLRGNLAYSFFVGVFFGVFIIDVIHSAGIVAKLRAFAQEHNVVVRYEEVKGYIRDRYRESKKRYHFLFPFRTEKPLTEHLKALLDRFEKYVRK